MGLDDLLAGGAGVRGRVDDAAAHDLLAEAQGHALVAEVVLQRLGDLGVDELEEALAALDEGDLDAERLHHGGVLGADHAAADDEEGPGEAGEVEQVVRVDDPRAVEGDGGGPGGTGADAEEEVVGLDRLLLVAVAADDGVGIDEAGGAGDVVDVVALELRADDLDLGLDDLLAEIGQVLDGDALLDGVGLAVDPAVLEAGEVEDGLAQRLGGDGAGVDRDAADDLASLDDADALADLGGLDRGPLAGGPAADDAQVVAVHGEPLRVRWWGVGAARTPASSSAIAGAGFDRRPWYGAVSPPPAGVPGRRPATRSAEIAPFRSRSGTPRSMQPLESPLRAGDQRSAGPRSARPRRAPKSRRSLRLHP